MGREPDQRSLDVLVVDAHEPLRLQIRAFLERMGLSVSEASTPQGVVSRAGERSRAPAALVIFHGATDGQWSRLAAYTRSVWATTPILFLCHSAVAERARSGDIGLTEYLEVPFAWGKFEQVVRGALGA